MGKTVVIAKQVSVNTSEDKFEDLFEIDGGQTLNVKTITFDFPTDARGYVFCSIYKGDTQVVPIRGEITVYSNWIKVNVNEKWESGTRIRIRVRNTDATNAHQVLIIVEGEYLN